MKRPAALTAFVAFSAAAQAAPETYVIDSSHTASLFSYRSLGVGNQTHRFDRISGRVIFDPAAMTGSADVTIDATSVNTGQAALNETLQNADFFDTANHPAITFRSTRITLGGEQPSLSGQLSIKGVTRPVTLALSHFQCVPDPVFRADACGARVSVTIRRSDFNMGKYAFLVSDEIRLDLALRAVKETSLLQVASRDPAR